MAATILSRNYLRRRDERRRVMLPAIVECRGATQKVRVIDFSASGVRLDSIKGLATGDPVHISLAPALIIEGQIAWSVWHKAGVKLLEPLTDDHPAYTFLLEQARAIERTRTLALVSLAKDRARS
ncbi:PilZ domain-containing protein [Hyphomicrobium sp. MC8b]|uniref:PilZ domain-containing protein n=1 Tax=unclassified Hyphomicrobium TaxID=2619925 RepID=UPI00391B987F